LLAAVDSIDDVLPAVRNRFFIPLIISPNGSEDVGVD
jgi:hypothetical protein